jgi:hypothetical protein
LKEVIYKHNQHTVLAAKAFRFDLHLPPQAPANVQEVRGMELSVSGQTHVCDIDIRCKRQTSLPLKIPDLLRGGLARFLLRIDDRKVSTDAT